MTETKEKIPGILIALTVIIITEILFFSGIISAYVIAASKAQNWPPVDQPRLPLSWSLTNMLVLVASGIFMYLFVKSVKKNAKKTILLVLTILLAIIFLAIQGSEWVNLVNFGAQNSDGLYASYFYSIIGLHGVHALFGLILLVVLYFKAKSNTAININGTRAVGYFWSFVCILWPILYYLIYLY